MSRLFIYCAFQPLTFIEFILSDISSVFRDFAGFITSGLLLAPHKFIALNISLANGLYGI